MSIIHAAILGTGHAYPSGILTNADLEKMVDTSDDWITTRTGIKQRRKAAPGEYTSQFASQASREAIERAGIDPTGATKNSYTRRVAERKAALPQKLSRAAITSSR